jgi:heme exporter protein A
MPAPHALDIAGLSKLFGRTVALRAVTLRLEPGQTLALLGANGSGKTTLLKIVAGAVSPTTGTVSIFGDGSRHGLLRARSHVGLLANETYLYDDLTATENVRFTLTMTGQAASDTRVLSALQAVRLVPHADDRVRSFSSGMKRRLAVARVQVLQPRLLLLDEPYNSLDSDGAEMIDDWIRSVTATGGTVVVATHDAKRIMALADLVGYLERGVLKYSGSVQGYKGAHALQVG